MPSTTAIDQASSINQPSDQGLGDTPDNPAFRRNSPARRGFRKLAKRLGPMVAAGANQETTVHRAAHRSVTAVVDFQDDSGHQHASESTVPSDKQATKVQKPLLFHLKLTVILTSGEKLIVQLPKNIDVKEVKISGNGELLWIISKKGKLYQFTQH